MSSPLEGSIDIAVVGAGVIGREHALRLAAHPRARVSAIVDPAPEAALWGAARSLPSYATTADMLEAHRPQGAIVATPTQDHAPTATLLLEAGIPVLIEKPLADDLFAAEALVRLVEQSGTPALVGYHRRHSPAMQAARQYVAEGHLGQITTVTATSLFYKPDRYFDAAWRTGPGGGPILINLAHDIDSLRALVGEISGVHAVASNRVRRHQVEDTAAVILEFDSGAIGTLVVSDCVVSPFSWEQTAGENPLYARDSSGDSLLLAGTYGSLALPSLRWWRQEDNRSWAVPFDTGRLFIQPADPLQRQLDHFVDVIEGRVQPLVSVTEGFRSLAVTLAVQQSALRPS